MKNNFKINEKEQVLKKKGKTRILYGAKQTFKYLKSK